jgi:hypothetical protein
LKNKIQLLIVAIAFLFLTKNAPAASAQLPIVYVYPAPYTVPDVNITFSLNVSIENVQGLYGWGFELYYPNSILNGINFTEGEFLKRDHANTLFGGQFTDNYNETHGCFIVWCSRISPELPDVNGSGVLATITFKSISEDDHDTLHLTVDLSDRYARPILCNVFNGQVTVVPEFELTFWTPILIVSTAIVVAFKKALKTQKRKIQ